MAAIVVPALKSAPFAIADPFAVAVALIAPMNVPAVKSAAPVMA